VVRAIFLGYGGCDGEEGSADGGSQAHQRNKEFSTEDPEGGERIWR
jgi:hypothetical protein